MSGRFHVSTFTYSCSQFIHRSTSVVCSNITFITARCNINLMFMCHLLYFIRLFFLVRRYFFRIHTDMTQKRKKECQRQSNFPFKVGTLQFRSHFARTHMQTSENQTSTHTLITSAQSSILFVHVRNTINNFYFLLVELILQPMAFYTNGALLVKQIENIASSCLVCVRVKVVFVAHYFVSGKSYGLSHKDK